MAKTTLGIRFRIQSSIPYRAVFHILLYSIMPEIFKRVFRIVHFANDILKSESFALLVIL